MGRLRNFVYIITNKNKTVLYTGVTSNLAKRIQEHVDEKHKGFSQKYQCKYLIYYEAFEHISHAIAREKQIKKWRREKKEDLINTLNPEWRFLNDEIPEILKNSKKNPERKNTVNKQNTILAQKSNTMTRHILRIPIRSISESPFQGRFFSDKNLKHVSIKKKLDELKKSIENSGLLQPIIVRPKDEGYELIDGHRRLEAHKQLGRQKISAIVQESSEEEAQVQSVVANLQRSNLSNLEKAIAFEKILKAGLFENRKALSVSIGKDETYIGDILNLLKMDNRIIEDLSQGEGSQDVRLLRMIRNAEKTDKNGRSDIQYRLYLRLKNENLSRTQLKTAIEYLKGPKEKKDLAIEAKKDGFNIKLNRKLTKEQQAKLQELMEQKMQESLKEVFGEFEVGD